MKVLLYTVCAIVLSACPVELCAQYPEHSHVELCAAYDAVANCPDSVNQYRFFGAFPERGEEFVLLYGGSPQLRGMGYDLHPVCAGHIASFWNLRQVNDSAFAEKAVRITCGLRPSGRAACYWLCFLCAALRETEKANTILDEVSRLRKGHQMEFWGFLWSASAACGLYTQHREYVRKNYPHLLAVYDLSYSAYRGEGCHRHILGTATFDIYVSGTVKNQVGPCKEEQ